MFLLLLFYAQEIYARNIADTKYFCINLGLNM